MKLISSIKLFVLLIAGASCFFTASAQCISSFPYTQDFEASNGNWTPGGTASDWSWGSPIKPVINSAGSGSKCWVIGTLTQSSYNNNENSTLTSPCFDFSSLTAPYLRFKIFWETEKKYDGASFQYSIDGGNTWTTLGSYADYTNCPNDNWYNTNSITTLGSDGWSGNIQPTAACSGGAGNGSGQWRLAQHEMSVLAGKSNVRFRFRFAAGSVCNNYDGFAIDDIWIGQAEPFSSDFSFNCVNSNTVSFQPASSPCQAFYIWNFDDPSSGASNISNQYNPTHTFSGPGQYNVKLTIQNGASPDPFTIKQVSIVSATISVINPIKCFGDKASLQADVNPVGTYTYEWNTVPVQTTPIATGLGQGSYIIKVSSANACPAYDTMDLVEPLRLIISLGNDTSFCPGQQLTLDPGSFSSYLWQDGSAAQKFIVTQTGNYSVTVANDNGCTASDDISVVVDCSDIVFPSALTPNGDGKNDLFGALGNLSSVKNYKLSVYNRWGQLVFHSSNPFQKWNGAVNGKVSSTQTFVWIVEYSLNTAKAIKKQKGTITVIR